MVIYNTCSFSFISHTYFIFIFFFNEIKSGTTSTIVHQVSQEVPDTTSRFEMPNEAQDISEKARRRTTTSGASRRITAIGDGGPIDMSNMPFIPHGL